jgi:hypothetical protein
MPSLVKKEWLCSHLYGCINELSFEQQIEKEVAGIRNFMDTIMKEPQRQIYYILIIALMVVDKTQH